MQTSALAKAGASIGAAVVLIAAPFFVSAQSYEYQSIDVTAEINEDSTVDISEQQTFSFSGPFTWANRRVSLQGLDRITDVRVIDAATGEPLTRVSGTLDSHAPDSAGKYTVFREGGEAVIEWYYNAENTTRTWTIEYTAHGAVSFYDDYDELYWNVYTDYSVPVRRSSITVELPGEFEDRQIQHTLYPIDLASSSTTTQSSVAYMVDETVPPQSALTIAVGFPIGVVSESAYWKGWLTQHGWRIAAVVTGLLALIAGIVIWYRTERWKKGRGTVVAHYEPPRGLPPAMGEVVVKERTSQKTWAATVVDLSVRGYTRIEEVDAGIGGIIKNIVPIIGILFFVVGGGFIFFTTGASGEAAWVVGVVLAVVAVVLAGSFRAKKITELFHPKEYRVTKTDKNWDDLREFERDFLRTLFSSSVTSETDVFSTKEIKKSNSAKRALVKKLKKVKDTLYKTIASETGLYEDRRGPIYNKVSQTAVVIGLLLFTFLLFIWGALPFAEPILFVIAVVIVGSGLWLFVAFEPRLSDEGAEERERWLGFKQYLETAERYRLEDLTPETFQRFLPYAMMFGVEKKWSRAFQHLDMSQPGWYTGYAGYGAVSSSGSGAPSFSATGFSSSFSSSFASAFASTGASGASGGGGAAGGGAGGGGGGAG